ncbi:MAG: sulfite exporter TauE/SafE family protein [Bradymonadaceae bacterium]
MEFAPYIYVLALLAGVLAGIINTLAGSGSLITLPVLIFLGLPANVANGTNRVAILFQTIIGVQQLKRGGYLPLAGSKWVIIATTLGAILGALVAVELDAEAMELAIIIVMIVMFFVILVRPQRWLREEPELVEGRPRIHILLLFFGVGLYGGFIQAGVGVLLLAALVLGAGHTLLTGNAIKLVVTLIYTIFILGIFIYAGQVYWAYGLLMAAGQGAGAFLGARFAMKVPGANVWVRRLLIVVVLGSIIKLLI